MFHTNTAVAPAAATTGCHYFCPDGYKANTAGTTCIAANSAKYLKCLAFIENFSVTHPYVDVSFTAMGSTTHVCEDLTRACPLNAGGDCEWKRQLAIQCRESVPVAPATATKTYIRVATNSMPDHCIQPRVSFPAPNYIDFEVEFSIATTTLT